MRRHSILDQTPSSTTAALLLLMLASCSLLTSHASATSPMLEHRKLVHPFEAHACGEGWDSSCRDDPTYKSRLGIPCATIAAGGFDCTQFHLLSMTDEEVQELIYACPCSCGIECGTYTVGSTPAPSKEPTTAPTDAPSFLPTSAPTTVPTSIPTASPSKIPTTIAPSTSSPSQFPTAQHTSEPSQLPTARPTANPSFLPTSAPTTTPTSISTASPPKVVPAKIISTTSAPSQLPTAQPTLALSRLPTARPTANPSKPPTSAPVTEPPSLPMPGDGPATVDSNMVEGDEEDASNSAGPSAGDEASSIINPCLEKEQEQPLPNSGSASGEISKGTIIAATLVSMWIVALIGFYGYRKRRKGEVTTENDEQETTDDGKNTNDGDTVSGESHGHHPDDITNQDVILVATDSQDSAESLSSRQIITCRTCPDISADETVEISIKKHREEQILTCRTWDISAEEIVEIDC